jgi:hypothetical protein
VSSLEEFSRSSKQVSGSGVRVKAGSGEKVEGEKKDNKRLGYCLLLFLSALSDRRRLRSSKDPFITTERAREEREREEEKREERGRKLLVAWKEGEEAGRQRGAR